MAKIIEFMAMATQIPRRAREELFDEPHATDAVQSLHVEGHPRVLVAAPDPTLDGLQPFVVAPAGALLGEGYAARTAERVVAVQVFVVEKAVDPSHMCRGAPFGARESRGLILEEDHLK